MLFCKKMITRLYNFLFGINDDKKIYLFSYGSNSIAQLKERIKKEEINYYPAYLNNHIRIFAGCSSKWNSGGVASVYPCKGEKIYGIACELNEEEMQKLDTFENGYTRTKTVICLENDREVYAYIYVKKNNTFSYFPSETYLEAISKMLDDRSGYKDHCLRIRGLVNGKIINFGFWSKEDGFSVMKKKTQ